jgi:hypothetical protein
MVEVSVDDGHRLLVGLKLAVRDAWRVLQGCRTPTPGSGPGCASSRGVRRQRVIWVQPGVAQAGRVVAHHGGRPARRYRQRGLERWPTSSIYPMAAELAKYGRVLVLLDACHSGGGAGDGSALTSNADLLRSIIAASNVTVLTSRIRWRDHRKCDLNAGHAGRTAPGAFHAPIIRIPMTSDPWAHPIPTPRAN